MTLPQLQVIVNDMLTQIECTCHAVCLLFFLVRQHLFGQPLCTVVSGDVAIGLLTDREISRLILQATPTNLTTYWCAEINLASYPKGREMYLKASCVRDTKLFSLTAPFNIKTMLKSAFRENSLVSEIIFAIIAIMWFNKSLLQQVIYTLGGSVV